MKAYSNLLRGYDNNRHCDRSKERYTAPSANKIEHKNRVSKFPDTKAYELPVVQYSHKRGDKK